MKTITTLAAVTLATPIALAAPPQYTITDMGLVDPGDGAAQGLGISPGGIAVGRSVGTAGKAFIWTTGSGLVPLPSAAGKAFCVANGANDGGLVAGTGADTFFGSGAVPLLWTGGAVAQLPISGGLGVGRANDVNASGVVVGSNGGGSVEVATYWSGGTVHVITATTGGGVTMVTAFRVNDAGIAVGQGEDPFNLARFVGVMYDVGAGTLTEVPPLAGDNGTIAFDVSQNGYVVGSSSFNQSDPMPFIWSSGTGTVAIPLPAGASTAIARGVNSDGWVVGVGSGLYAVPFLYDGDQTYRVQDLIPDGTGWDLATNTSSSALGIAEDGSIVGTGVLDGDIRAYRLTPASVTGDVTGDGVVSFADVLALLSMWGPCPGCAADLDGDDMVGFSDLLILLSNWT